MRSLPFHHVWRWSRRPLQPWERASRRFQSHQSHALKRDWTDLPFQDGYAKNQEVLKELENEMRTRFHELSSSSSSPALAQPEDLLSASLQHPEALGGFLDLCGAYLKNYEVDKASAIMEAIMPACEVHGGLFLMKALNHLSTVRMKQGRAAETWEILERMEELVTFTPEEAWEFFVTLYRNKGWALSSLGRTSEALEYFHKLTALKQSVGEELSWFDFWDLGRTAAILAVDAKDYSTLQFASEQVKLALTMHWNAEGEDLVMRAKILHTLGETYLALDLLHAQAPTSSPSSGSTASSSSSSSSTAAHLHKECALEAFEEAHTLFEETEGKYNPLTGGEAEACALVLCQLERYDEAKAYLYRALKALSLRQSGWGSDTKALHSACLVLDNILAAHRETDDRDGLEKYHELVEETLRQARKRASSTADAWERFVSSSTMVLVASGSLEGRTKAQKVLKAYGGHLGEGHLLQPLRLLLLQDT
eukprot:GEMP01052787.1.p1 GENE.GEMP01052787.1~~GEMP01052787.1.p1  ORF type:complete len:480 (+),score=141.19 GEMP01052787.1:114-1553(+)